MPTHGRYEIIKKIADGGMAEIFLARQSGAEGFARTVILKRILPAFSADPHFRNMLVDEAHIAMSLNHGNIVPVLDLGRADGRYFLVMELVDGWDLNSIIKRAKAQQIRVPLGLSLYVITQVCRGLAYAHAKKNTDGKPLGIVHRDISPQNVLVSEQGEVKVTDFGIAKALGKRERTQAGVIKGKLDFMSPEQAKGHDLDASSDVFAVGTMLYLLTTGKRPFDGRSDLEALLKAQKAEFAPPEEVNPELPNKVVRIIKKAMQARTTDRYRSAEEMMWEVEEVLRSDFRSAGQSDLKRWLNELAQKDGTPTASQLPGLPMDVEEQGRPMGTGHTLDLEDTSVVAAMAETQLRPPTPPPGTLPEPARTPVTMETYPPAPAARRHRRRQLGAVAALAVVAIGGFAGARLLSRGTRQSVTDGARKLIRAGDKMAGQVADQVADKIGLPTEEKKPDKPAAPPIVESKEEKEEKREETRPPTNQMRLTLTTRPTGASVVGPRGTLGRTPLTLTTRVGSTQALTFAKDGFASTTRKITAHPRRPKVEVVLVRKKTKRRR